MSQASEVGAVLATVSKHDIGGIIAIVVGALVIGFGFVRVAARMALFLAGLVVVVIGILLVTRTI